ncbi:hypothetical protein [Pseudomonas aeruginosa]|uniref:hypothetical protein n=1 Tax=Pseudomonas aeruginosa TaxID=287 RepID=UPI002D7BA1F0|nr:hypothetical protein [Pseudomonas aeruginosa]HBO3464853.1 hypothetical protein [Pseudomonas aeruginosa]HEP9680952.1 hypothetical protein [Pseudomonas aeruginosa]HEP9700870.1 hypothetical protein [Pseudomonas aeruginosa]HEP9808353.1 hypothetical protein [Pseudomonas aeruginosa]
MEQAMRDEFEAWWNLPAQSELRKSCARGWAEVIWKASRAALRVEDEIDRLKAENEELRGALQAVVDDPAWRSNDNTLWPKIIKALGKGATQ